MSVDSVINFKRRVSEAIEKIGMSDADVAQKLGVNRNTISAYKKEKGDLKGIVLLNLVNEFEFNPDWLLTGRGPEKVRRSEIVRESKKPYTVTENIDMVLELNDILDRFGKTRNKRRAIQEIYSLIMSQTSPRPGGGSRITGDQNVQTVGDGNFVEKK